MVLKRPVCDKEVRGIGLISIANIVAAQPSRRTIFDLHHGFPAQAQSIFQQSDSDNGFSCGRWWQWWQWWPWYACCSESGDTSRRSNMAQSRKETIIFRLGVLAAAGMLGSIRMATGNLFLRKTRVHLTTSTNESRQRFTADQQYTVQHTLCNMPRPK